MCILFSLDLSFPNVFVFIFEGPFCGLLLDVGHNFSSFSDKLKENMKQKRVKESLFLIFEVATEKLDKISMPAPLLVA